MYAKHPDLGVQERGTIRLVPLASWTSAPTNCESSHLLGYTKGWGGVGRAMLI